MTQHFTTDKPQRRRTQLGLVFTSRRPRATTLTDNVLEAEVQRSILALLAKHPSIAFAHRINSRVLDVEDKKSKTGKRPMRMAPKGHPDIAGMLVDGRALYIECKSTQGVPTDEQIDFLQRVNRHGGLGIIARSIDDVLRHLPLSSTTQRSAGLDIL